MELKSAAAFVTTGVGVVGSATYYYKLNQKPPVMTLEETIRKDFLHRITHCEVDDPEQTHRIKGFLHSSLLSMGVLVQSQDVNLQTVISSANALHKSGITSGTAHVLLPGCDICTYDYVIHGLGLAQLRERWTCPLSEILQKGIGLSENRKPLLIIVSHTGNPESATHSKNILGLWRLAMDAHSRGLRHKFIVICNNKSVAQKLVDSNGHEKIRFI